jgi:hypothetical protein
MTATSVLKKRWHRWMFLPITKNIRTVTVKFSEAIGKDLNSWKGGILEVEEVIEENESVIEAYNRVLKSV